MKEQYSIATAEYSIATAESVSNREALRNLLEGVADAANRNG